MNLEIKFKTEQEMILQKYMMYISKNEQMQENDYFKTGYEYGNLVNKFWKKKNNVVTDTDFITFVRRGKIRMTKFSREDQKFFNDRIILIENKRVKPLYPKNFLQFLLA
jgi:hypothetical protein